MRLTDFWERMDQALGAGYSRSWAADFHIDELGGLTAEQALNQGIDTQIIWRAVHAVLELPHNQR